MQSTVKILLFINTTTECSFSSKRNDLIESKDILEIFYYDTDEIAPNNKAQEKDFVKRKVVLNTASKSYYKLLTIYETQYDKPSEVQRKV